MMKVRIVISTILLILVKAVAAEDSISGYSDYVPYDKKKLSTPKKVLEVRTILDIDETQANEIEKKTDRAESILDGTISINILQEPLLKPLKTIDTIYLHPSFLTTLIFPKHYKISDATTSFKFNVFEFDNNVIRVQPNPRVSGNIAISLSDNKANYSLTIFVKKYIANIDCKETETGCKNDYLAVVIRYKENNTIDPFKIIEDYLLLNQKHKLVISQNLEHVSFSKGGETYYIIRDDEFGTIYKDGLSLVVQKKL